MGHFLALLVPSEPLSDAVPINLSAKNVMDSSFSLGGNLWPSPTMPSPVRQTGMTLLRLWIDDGLSATDSPTNLTQQAADAWANQTVNAHGHRAFFHSFSADAASAGVEILLGGGSFGAPYLVSGENHVFDAKRIADTAMMWAAIAKRMAAPDCPSATASSSRTN